MFEANYQSFFDYIILVTANKENRFKRAVKRKNIDVGQINKRMKLQMKDKDKINLSDFVIENDDDIQHLKNEFEQVMKKII